MTKTGTEFSSALDEVVISVHFNELGKLSILHLAELIGIFARKGFSKGEEHAIVTPPVEPSQTQEFMLDAQINVTPLVTPLFPRIWLIHQRGNMIIQMQRDRFTFNWRRYGTYTDIPGYSVIFQEFKKLYNEFTEFIRMKKIGLLNPLQFELSYVYEVSQDSGKDIFTSIGKACNIFNNENINPFWYRAKSLNLRISFQMDYPNSWIFLGVNNHIKLPEENQVLRIDFSSINFKVNEDKEMSEWFQSAYNEIIKKSDSLTLDSNQT